MLKARRAAGWSHILPLSLHHPLVAFLAKLSDNMSLRNPDLLIQRIMLNPNLTQADLQQALNSATSVTNFAQAIVTAIPSISDPPSWYGPIQADISAAQTRAQNWIDNTCPAVTKTIPGAIIAFNGSFQSATTQLLNLLNEIDNQPGSKPTAAQRSTVSTQINNLISAVETQQKSVEQVRTQVAGYTASTNSDQQKIATDLGAATAKFTNGASAVSQVSAALGENFLDSQQLGPCNVIVNVNFNVSIKVDEVGADPTLVTTIYAKAILENVVNNVQGAQKAVQTVYDAWGILQSKFTAVLTNLNDATDDSYADDFKQLDIQTAQAQWQQLTTYAQGLQ